MVTPESFRSAAGAWSKTAGVTMVDHGADLGAPYSNRPSPASARVEAGSTEVPRRSAWSSPAAWTVLSVTVLAGVMRIPYFGRQLTADETGYLLVARQWHVGSSLYGDYWVDRPPVLIEIYRLAGQLGSIGLGDAVALRLIGAIAAMATTLIVALTAARWGGWKSALAAGGVAATTLATPLVAGEMVDGELLAAPFLAFAFYSAIAAWAPPGIGYDESNSPSTYAWAVWSGAAALIAVFIKQNMLDGIVFMGALAMLAALTRRGTRRRAALRTSLAWLVGALAAIVTVLGLAALRGTSPGGVWFAMYPFRLQAAGVQAAGAAERFARFGRIAELGLGTLAPILIVVAIVVVWRRRQFVPSGVTWVAAGLAAVSSYDVVSIFAGGSYWAHYLIELIVPAALAVGLLCRRDVARRLGLVLAVAAMFTTTAAWIEGLNRDSKQSGAAMGNAIAQVAQPHDTVVSLLGDADVVYYSRLHSPYRYLWSLPARTLDPDFTALAGVLNSKHRPTWVVVRGQGTLATLQASAVGESLTTAYHPFGYVCGRPVYLRDGVNRALPVGALGC